MSCVCTHPSFFLLSLLGASWFCSMSPPGKKQSKLGCLELLSGHVRRNRSHDDNDPGKVAVRNSRRNIKASQTIRMLRRIFPLLSSREEEDRGQVCLSDGICLASPRSLRQTYMSSTVNCLLPGNLCFCMIVLGTPGEGKRFSAGPYN